jgi:cell division protein FtsQ
MRSFCGRNESGGMSTGPEVYPAEALVDEEPRYLRRQKPLEIRRRKFGRRNWPAYRRWAVIGVGIFAGGWIASQGVRFLLFSPLMQLASLDQIEIVGSQYVSRSVITESFVPDLGKSILWVPLDARRKALESIPWVERATVQRALPNRIRVEVTERTPVAFLRLGNELALVDAGGVVLEKPLGGNFNFPVVSGLDEKMALSDRGQRMRLLVDFLREIDLANAGASEQVSEADLSDAQDVRAMLAGLPGLGVQEPIWVHFGSADFTNKYQLLVQNIGHWSTSAGRVESIDLRFSRQVVVNPDTEPGASRPLSAEHRSRAATPAQ